MKKKQKTKYTLEEYANLKGKSFEALSLKLAQRVDKPTPAYTNARGNFYSVDRLDAYFNL